MKKLRNVFAVMIVSLISMGSYAQSDISGEWSVGEKNTIVNVYEKEGVRYGKVVSSDNSKAKIGTLVIKDVKKSNGKWKGKVYSPKRKSWYDAEFSKKGDKLKIKISAGFMNKTIEWTKK